MSSTLTWRPAGPQTKTGTGNADFVNDLVSLIASKSADAAFLWEVADSSNVNPFFVNLRRKSGAAGRILFVCHSSAPAGTQPVLYDAAPTANAWGVAYFPAGNIATPTNLAAASGTVMGVDTNSVGISSTISIGALYLALGQIAVWASQDAIFLEVGQAGATTSSAFAAGEIVVDANDNAYPAVWGMASSTSYHLFSTKANSPAAQLPGTTLNRGTSGSGDVLTNYGGTNRRFWQGMVPNGWGQIDAGSTDIMEDTAANRAWFVPVNLVGRTKGIGMPLKWRQLAYGPGRAAGYRTLQITGPTDAAFDTCMMTSAVSSGGAWPWLTNFKI